MTEPIQSFLSQIVALDCRQHRGFLAVRFGLRRPAISAPRVISLRAALKAGSAKIREKGSGEVGRLSIRNSGQTPILGLAGELLVGGRQDRLLNTSVLIAPGAEASPRVSCVEQHRWSAEGRGQGLRSDGSTASGSVRSVVHQSVVTSLLKTGQHTTDQGLLWKTIHRTLWRTGTLWMSPTGTLVAGLRGRSRHLDACARACAPTWSHVGLALFAPGTQHRGPHGLVSIDCFESPVLLANYGDSLLRAAALEASEDVDPSFLRPATFSSLAEQILAALARVQPLVSRPAAGEARGAREHHYLWDDLVASVICLDDQPIHLGISPADSQGNPMVPGGPSLGSASPGSVSPGSASPGSASPGSASPGSASPGSASPGSVSSGSASRGHASPGSASPGSASPGSASPGSASPGSAVVHVGGAAAGPGSAHRARLCPPSPRCYIRIICPGAETRVMHLEPGSYLLGRSSASDILFSNPEVSRRHALLEVGADGDLSIRDLGSSNGTYLDTEEVVFSSLKAGDMVSLGRVVLLIPLGPQGQSPLVDA